MEEPTTRFIYPAQLQRTGVDEIVVSFRDLGVDEIVVSFRDLTACLTSGADETEALAEAADALEEDIAGRIDDLESIPYPLPVSVLTLFEWAPITVFDGIWSSTGARPGGVSRGRRRVKPLRGSFASLRPFW